MKIVVEFVYEPPWEREARLLGLSNLLARSHSGLRSAWMVKNLEMPEGAALFETAPSDTNWLPQRDRGNAWIGVSYAGERVFAECPRPSLYRREASS